MPSTCRIQMSSSLSPVYLTIIGVASDSGLSLTQKHVAGGVSSTHPSTVAQNIVGCCTSIALAELVAFRGHRFCIFRSEGQKTSSDTQWVGRLSRDDKQGVDIWGSQFCILLLPRSCNMDFVGNFI